MAFHACIVILTSAFNAGFASLARSPTLHHPAPASGAHPIVGLISCACTFHPSVSDRFSFRAAPPPSKDASSATVLTMLSVQDLSKLDINTLTPLTPEVISRQATVNVGTIGHVAHGKSTLVKAISGVQTVRFKTEHERNITIKLGYANAKIYKCSDDDCPRPACYRAYGSAKEDAPDCEVPGCGSKMKLLRHVSFVDCPGHDVLMATMLTGTATMDAALLLIAGNEPCPQPQTLEHLAAVEIMQLKHIIIVQNKIDLVRDTAAETQYAQIREFVSGTVAAEAPVVPISAQLKYNIDVVVENIVKRIPIPVRDFASEPKMIVIRSFDVNKPGEGVADLKGGIAGGSIVRGILKVGDRVEVRPGIPHRDDTTGKMAFTPIISVINRMKAEANDLQYAVPGGLIGVGLKIDPTLTRADRLVGQMLGLEGKVPDVFSELEVNFYLLRRLLGVKVDGDAKGAKVSKLDKGETLMLNIGSLTTGGRVLASKRDMAKFSLSAPVCTSIGEKIAISRRVDKHWRLIGWGELKGGKKLEPTNVY